MMLRAIVLASFALTISAVPFDHASARANLKFNGYTVNTTALDDYVAKADPTYHWVDLNASITTKGWKAETLNLTSQTWLSAKDTSCSLWWHYLVVITPFDLKHKDTMFMYITGFSNNAGLPDAKTEDVLLAASVAMATGTRSSVLFQIPNEPCLFANDPAPGKSRSEDAIIALTWYHFTQYPDQPEWLLRLPMTKAVVRAMDTLEDYIKADTDDDINGFVIAGASKRGWTTWTTAAVDKRVIAAIPIVMSALNFVENVHHYWRAYGGWTFAFEDYYALNFTKNLDLPQTQQMMQIVDPYVYRHRLTMPFMLISTTGDEFFMPDDTQYFWNDMPGTKHFLMLQNAEHSCITGIPEIIPAISSFSHSILLDRPLPKMNWTISDDGTIMLDTSVQPKKVIGRHADTISTTRRDWRLVRGPENCTFPDFPVKGACFQPVIWHKVAQKNAGTHFEFSLPAPPKGWRAFFLEVEFDAFPLDPVILTTQVSILPKEYPFPDCHGDSCQGSLV